MKETKNNILTATLKLFNEKGFVNVRLQHIADEANVSIGNLAYHYATKKELLANVYKNLVQKQTELLNELNIVPLFENLDRHWDNVFEIQAIYSFFYQDTLEIVRYDEFITREYRNHINWEKDQFCRLIEFNISRGAFHPMVDTEIAKIAEYLWAMENSWLQYSLITGMEPVADDFKEFMWQVLLPHFSHIGNQEYEQLIKNKMIPL
ncbi:MAG: TetR/AcrR family transcriptional regulator [Bacteroidota bacterium]